MRIILSAALMLVSLLAISQITSSEIVVTESGETVLQYQGQTKLEVTSSGVKVHGDVTADNIEGVSTFTKTLQLTTSYQDTGIEGLDLENGTYILQIARVNDYSVGGGHYSEYYSGIMSWFSTSTNSTVTDEIPLHRAGHAPNSGRIYLRVARHTNSASDDLVLQIKANYNASGPFSYTFKFKKMI